MGTVRSTLRSLLRHFLFLLGFVPIRAIAQNEVDAVRLSTVAPGGTARSIGLANAFGALGADGAAIAINPAGAGLYRTSELSLSLGFDVNSIKSAFYGTSASRAQSRLYLGNFTLALNSPAEKGSDWRGSTFGLVYDRQATHHWSSQASASGIPSSILDDFAWQAEGTRIPDIYDALPFTSGLAYETYGIDPIDPADTVGTSYVPALPAGALVDQTGTLESHGATTSTSFFYANNYMDRFYIGASLGIVGFRYKEVSSHSETVPDGSIDLKDLTFREQLNVTGNGIDLKIGFIARLTDRFRAGLAIHSPMWTQLNDVYTTDMRTSFRTPSPNDGRTNYSASSPENVYNYRVNSPWKAVASAAYVAGQHGLVSIDYTYTDYAQARFRPSNKLVDNYSFNIENDAIKSSFRAVHAVRVGTEWRSGNWYFRLGWGFVPDAYRKDDLRHGLAQRTYAGGLGYRSDHLGIDLGMNYVQGSSTYYPYDASIVGPVTESRSTIRSLITVSLRP